MPRRKKTELPTTVISSVDTEYATLVSQHKSGSGFQSIIHTGGRSDGNNIQIPLSISVVKNNVAVDSFALFVNIRISVFAHPVYLQKNFNINILPSDSDKDLEQKALVVASDAFATGVREWTNDHLNLINLMFNGFVWFNPDNDTSTEKGRDRGIYMEACPGISLNDIPTLFHELGRSYR